MFTAIKLLLIIIMPNTLQFMTNAAFTLYGFDNQERNLMFVQTAFQVLKLKFLLTV